MIPNSSIWEVEKWKFNNRDQVNSLTDEQLLVEWRYLANAIQVFFNYRVNMTMEMSWLFSAIIAIASERKLDLNIEDGNKAG